MSPVPLEGRRVVLIGGAGFIGHHLALALVREGAHVQVIDSLQVNNLLSFAPNGDRPEESPAAISGQAGPPPNRGLYLKIIHERLELLHRAGVLLHVQDARDYHALSRLITQTKPQVVIHLAAVAHAGKSNKDPYSTFDHSLRTLENALDSTRSTLEHFIYFSSSMVYGDFENGSVTEESRCEPRGIYGALKFAGEKITIAYHQVFNLPYTIIRPSALYGPRCVSRRVGQVFIENALRGSKLVVEGDGSEAIDFTYIDDLVEGVLLVLRNKNSLNQIFNMTTGVSHSIRELIEVIREHFPAVEVEVADRDRLTPFRGALRVDKARALLGYAPRTTLKNGIARYIDWYRTLMRPLDSAVLL